MLTAGNNYSIARRIRYNVRLLMIISVAALMLTIGGYGTVYYQGHLAVENQIETLRTTETLNQILRDITQLNSLIDHIDNNMAPADRLKDLADIEQRILSERLGNNESPKKSSLLSTFGQYKKEALKAIAQQKAYINLTELYQTSENETIQSLDAMEISIERLSIEKQLEFYSSADSSQADNESLKRLYSEAFAIAESIAANENMSQSLLYLKELRTILKCKEFEEEFRLNLRKISNNLTSISETKPEEDNIHDDISAVFSLIQGKSSPFEIRQKIIEVTQSKTNDLERLITTYNAVINELRRYSSSDITSAIDSKISAENISYSVLIVTTVLLILAVLVFGYIMIRVLMRKIFDPLLEITQITQRLSQGDLSLDIPDYESIELHRMADALSVFKRNALELKEANINLQIANEDVKNFAFAASHDLKSPLRGISNLVEFLQEDIGPIIDEESQKNLYNIQRRVNRLEDLLDDLLAYARAGKENTEKAEVDPRVLLSEISELFNSKTKFSLIIESAPKTIYVERAPFEQVLRNLIDNAIKHNDLDVTECRVFIKEFGGHYEVMFCDNGPGIPKQYHERVFEIFKKLKSRDEVEGSGMGLSLILKLIKQQSGTINIISDPDTKRGTCFRFTWVK